MKDLIIGNVVELFSKQDLDDIAKDYGFTDRSLLQGSLNKLCSAFKMYLAAEPSSTKKDIRKAYKAISSYSDKLAKALDISLSESAVLHSSLGMTRQELRELLSNLSSQSNQRAEVIKGEGPGRKMSVDNEFILGLIDLYREGTGRKLDDIVYDETAEKENQYRGDSLSFLRHILLKAGVRKADAALVQLIKRNKKHK
ncbi:MAG: hypothetical protein HOM20_02350 [Porticoccaceae bacterium]|jgi:hypothetical protein|nr:hypothetical protein [Porticoccaceae bacterium]